MNKKAAAQAIDAFLKALGHDPATEPHLEETGARVAEAFATQLLSGYGVDLDALLSNEVMTGGTELVVVRDVPVTTVCPHHLLPATGFATVAFAPDEKIVGVGTIAEVIDACARRLSLQEEIGDRVVRAIEANLAPVWVACRLVLTHACMTARHGRTHGTRVETVAIAGSDAVDEAFVYSILGVGR